ncbi:esterase family protein [Gordonia sp. HNM0687]|uniref:Esterase family protein n=1 Tax=Gordonia mangrovi TaxID=2665643 RepID=A0A6L7GNW9_9ACTN|nr:alpha/beta hydrolase family protein [Gordonia mangrovi]MXP21614.1 esterase family protein [Gordonia mangrovi]UVF80356.1 esterase family protein [Gordonia mangrovi]
MRKSYRWSALVAAMLIGVLAAPGVAHADTKVAEISKASKLSPLRTDIWVDSPSMGGKVKVSVLTPQFSSGPRSTVYLLDGADAGEDVSDWITKGKAGKFFADKNVNVVLPTGGAGSFYTNWVQHDPALGKPQWETFLTKELPPLIDERFDGTGRNAVVGLSMGGQSAFTLAMRQPALYSGIASLSGCPPVSGPVNESYVRTTVARSGGDATNMWGPFGSANWAAHDPSKHLDRLRGKDIFIAAGSGAIGPRDLTAPYDPEDGPREAVTAAGSALELGAWRCSLEFAATLRANNVAFTDGFRLIGTHSWIYWEQDLRKAWPTISRGL